MMLKIRKEHWDALAEAAMRDFESRLEAHLRQHLPEKCAAMERRELREAIRRAVGQARSYGLVAERDISLFVNLAFVLGANFDRNPKYPWAAEILKDPALKDAETRITRLYEEAEKRLKEQGASHG